MPPGNRLEALAGDRKGQHSIRINDQWRVCFKWTTGGPSKVEIVDYHWQPFPDLERQIFMTRQVPYPHPGEILVEDFLKPLGSTPYRLAKAIHVPQTRIAAIISGERAVTADTALRLARYFSMSDCFWTNLQTAYHTAMAKDELAEELATIEQLEAA